MIGWVTFGSLLTLASAFGLTTVYYRRRARRAETKPGLPAALTTATHPGDQSRARSRSGRKYKCRDLMEGAEARFLQPGTQVEVPDYFLGGESEETADSGEFCPEEGVFGDRYDRHGVKIEQNCFI